MYAIIRTGGKQYRVQPGDVIRVEKLENKLGTEFDMTEVLMIGGETPVLGQPVVKNAKVTVVVTKQTRERKIIIFKKKRRQGYRRFKTHRQLFTELFVKAISLDGKVAKSEATAKVVDFDKEKQDRIAARTVVIDKSMPKIREETKTAKPAAKKTAPKKAAAKKPAKKKAGAAKSKKAVGAKKKATSKKA
jgi:large subunit ribosomal protein L21